MPKKPSAVDASTILATKEKAAVTETLVDLNFKVPADFRHRFKQLALDARLKNVHLLVRAVEAYDREQGRENL